MTSLRPTEEQTARIVALMKQGFSLDQIAVKLMPENRRETMRRTALLRRFDRQAFQLALKDAADDVEEQLGFLESSDQLKRISGREDVFVADESVRSRYLEQWKDDREAFVHLNDELAQYFADAGSKWELERLHHLLAANPAEGLRLLQAMLRDRLPQPNPNTEGAVDAVHPEAQDGIAVAAAYDVLKVAAAQLRFLPVAQKEIYLGESRLVDTWTCWSDAWYRSRRYSDRPDIHAWFRELMDGSHVRVLEIHAPGGSGKTMLLRWLIAHHCIPRRLPIAHLDFDNLIGLKLAPWQLLLRCARQLNCQIGGAPFESLIQEADRFVDSVSQPVTQGRRDEKTVTMDVERIQSFAKSFLQRFGKILNSIGEETVTIVIDTFEEAMQRQLIDVPRFVAQLARLSQVSPRLRIIISGRYAIEGFGSIAHKNYGEILKAEYPAEYQHYSHTLRRECLPHFRKAEAKRYIEQRQKRLNRPLNITDEQLDRLLASQDVERPKHDPRRGQISPFDLALVVDLLSDRDDSKTDQDDILKDMDTVRTIYLIERVISRIKRVEVRWLLRYGVIPRVLTKSFFEQVIVPHLRNVNAGKSDQDTPGSSSFAAELPADLQEESLFFAPTAIDERGTDAMWNDLSDFASADSWVEKRDGGLSFHPRVRRSMNNLLRQHAVLRSIHADAARYFADVAEQALDPQENLAALLEMVYHRIQLRGDEGAQYLENLPEKYESQQDAADIIRIAQAIAADEREGAGDSEAPSLSALQRGLEAQFESAINLFDLADTEPASRKALAAAEQAASDLATLELSQPTRELLKAVLTVRTSHSATELKDAVALFLETSRPEFGSLRRRSLAIGLESLNDARCVGILRQLLEERLEEDHPADTLTAFLLQSFARVVRAFGDRSDHYELLASAAQLDGFTEANQLTVSRSVAAVLKTWMRPASAADYVTGRDHQDDPELTLVCRLAHGRSDPAQATRSLMELLSRLNDGMSRGPTDGMVPSILVNQAWYTALLADVTRSMGALHDAIGTFIEDSQHSQAAWCHLMEAEIWLHHHGNVKRAQAALDRRRDSIHSGSEEDDSDWLRQTALQFALDVRVLATVPESETLLAAAERTSLLHEQLRCALTLLAVPATIDGEEALARVVRLLISALERLPDVIARSDYPWLLRDSVDQVSLRSDQEERLLELLHTSKDAPEFFGQPASDLDRAWALLAHAHLLRFIGRADLARENSDWAKRAFFGNGSLTGMREVWYLESVCNWRVPKAAVLDQFRGYAPLLEAVVSIEQAEFASRRKDRDSMEAWLDGLDMTLLAHYPSGYAGRAELVWSELHRLRGDDAAADEALLRASKAFDPLGNPHLMQVRGSQLESMEAPSISDTAAIWSVRPCIEIAIDKRQGTQGSGGPWIRSVSRHISNEKLRHVVVEDHEVAPFALVESIASRPADLVSDILRDMTTDSEPPAANVSSDVCLSIVNHRTAAGIPWELAWHDVLDSGSDSVIYRAVSNAAYRARWLRAALRSAGFTDLDPDGLAGLDVSNALQEFAREHDGRDSVLSALRAALAARREQERPRAVVLQSTQHRQKSGQRGLGFEGTSDTLADVYEKQGFRCDVFQGRTLDMLTSIESDRDFPAIVHVFAPYVESHSMGTAEPDLGERFEGKGFYKNSFSGIGEVRECPLLILDGPGEPEPTEQLRQVFLRNAAALQLTAQPRFPNVLAMGLDPEPDFALYYRFLAGIRSGGSLRELFRDIVAEPIPINTRSLFERPGRLVPSLWTSDPDLSVLY